ncbi:hypothetical protein E4U47_001315 [Claviceps purpurea]|nr:hypothetical protein E4U47_001315 [Claviceps purpurea]
MSHFVLRPCKELSAEPLERRLTTPASSRYYERLAAKPAGRTTWIECPYLNVEVDLPRSNAGYAVGLSDEATIMLNV